MMNYIAAGDGQFINLAAVVVIEDTGDEIESKATLTTLTGDEIDIKGDDADKLFERIGMIALETDAAQARLRQIANIEVPT